MMQSTYYPAKQYHRYVTEHFDTSTSCERSRCSDPMPGHYYHVCSQSAYIGPLVLIADRQRPVEPPRPLPPSYGKLIKRSRDNISHRTKRAASAETKWRRATQQPRTVSYNGRPSPDTHPAPVDDKTTPVRPITGTAPLGRAGDARAA